MAWGETDQIELHAFGDASEKGYGACVYIRIVKKDTPPTVSFVISKGKVAPLNKITLPSLELLGALLCARLVTFVQKSLQFPPSMSYKC